MGIRAAVLAGTTLTVLTLCPATSPGPASASAGHQCASATRRCDGTIEVPLDWADPGSERITVSFAWIPRRDWSRPATGTVLTIHGGPAAALPMTEVYRRAMGEVLDSQNMLIVDPRGLGGSTPLLCPGAQLDQPDTVAECTRRLEPRVRFFTTDQAVADFDAVRHALGVDAVSVYGSSYGTVWGHAYATRFPQRTRAVLLESVVDTDDDGYVRWSPGRPVRPDLANLDVVCRPSRPCRALPGEPAQTWTNLVTRLRARADPAVPMAAVLRLPQQAVEPVVGRELNAAANAYLSGDPLPLRRLVRAFTGTVPSEPDPTVAGYLAYVCGDARYVYRREASPAERRRELDAMYARQRPFAPFTTAEVLVATGGDQHQWCLDWSTPRDSPPVPPRTRYPRIPMLATGGELDPATPADNAVDLAGRFPRGTAVVHRFGGHTPALGVVAGLAGTYWTCAAEVMRSFLRDPDRFRQHDGCSARNYQAIHSFPTVAADIRDIVVPGLAKHERTLAASAVATALDALARRNPNGAATSRLSEEPGLRGGMLRFPDSGTVTLDHVRFVSDVDAIGQVSLQNGNRAQATLTVAATDARPHQVHLDWMAFQADRPVLVSGTLDGRSFRLLSTG